MRLAAMFLGVGSANAHALGNSSMVILRDNLPWLMIDCGFDSLKNFQQNFDKTLPNAVYITHCHYDHIGGLEQLYYQSRFSGHKPRIYLPHSIVSTLVHLLENTGLAESGENIWDVFQLVPVIDSFYHDGMKFKIYPARHHRPMTAFSLHLPGYFFYSGDTRPVPEIIHHEVNQNEVIFHDCCVNGNPSHTGLDDLIREYSAHVLARTVVYHYHYKSDRQLFSHANLQVAESNRVMALPQLHDITLSAIKPLQFESA